MKYFRLILKLSAGALPAFLFAGSCAATFQTDPLYIRTDGNLDKIPQPTLLVPEGSKCTILAQKRVVYVLFAIPTSEIDPEIMKGRKAIRYREIASPLDVLLSVAGFLVGITVRTKVLEACQTDAVLLTGERAKRYEAEAAGKPGGKHGAQDMSRIQVAGTRE